MSDKKRTFKSFKEFAKVYFKEYDDANFTGVGGFSIGSLDSIKPIADLGDVGPNNQGTGYSRGTLPQFPQKNIKKNKKRFQKIEDESIIIDTPLYKHMIKQGIIKSKKEQ
jgi:hypothetical protein